MYTGDLTDGGMNTFRAYPGLNLSIQTQRARTFVVQLNAGFGRFADQYDELSPIIAEDVIPVTFVETSYFYGDLTMRFMPMPYSRVRPFAALGAGFLIFSPKDLNGKFLSDVILSRPEGEDYNTAVPQLPISVGVETEITGMLGVSLAYTYRFAPTDYLDNIGTLGHRGGYDRLHNVNLSLFINFAARRGRPTIPVKPGGLDVIAHYRAKAADSLLLGWNNVQETQLASQPTEAEDPELPPTTRPVLSTTVDSLARIEALTRLCEQAIAEGKVIYFLPESFDSYASVFARFSVPKEVVQSLNGLEDAETLPLNNSLVIPNLKSYLDAENQDDVAAQAQAKWEALEQAALEESRYIYYQIKKDDNLTEIAGRYKTRVSTIRKLNALRSDKLFVGTYLRLPNLGIPVSP